MSDLNLEVPSAK